MHQDNEQVMVDGLPLASRDHWKIKDDEKKHALLKAYGKTSRKAIILVGNKVDLESERKVSREEAERYAKDLNILYTEISVKSGLGVHECFDAALCLAKQKNLLNVDVIDRK